MLFSSGFQDTGLLEQPQEPPQPSPASRFEVSLKPPPLADSIKSTWIGFTSSNNVLSIIKIYTPISEHHIFFL
jgi:hypothetical protein